MHDKRVVLVTGANQGVGLQTAKELVANGLTVLIGSRNLERGEAAANEIGPGAVALQLDVTDGDSIVAAAERIRHETGRLDLLVNNAAISNTTRGSLSLQENAKTKYPSNVSLDEVRAVWETNVFGVLAVYQAMLPLLRESPDARIVNVSSGVGSLTANADPAYAPAPDLAEHDKPRRGLTGYPWPTTAGSLDEELVRDVTRFGPQMLWFLADRRDLGELLLITVAVLAGPGGADAVGALLLRRTFRTSGNTRPRVAGGAEQHVEKLPW